MRINKNDPRIHQNSAGRWTTTFLVLSMSLPFAAFSDVIWVGDIEISPADFSAELDPNDRIAKCLACHGNRGRGDIDFGPDVHYGTPAVEGMREDYLKESLIAYKTGTRIHKEMSAISSMLDGETIDFMAHALAGFEVPPVIPVADLETLAKQDSLFLRGRNIALQGIPKKGVPACMACHGQLGEGGAVGPRLAGQNILYIENQFQAFANGTRRTVQSTIMQPVVAGLTSEDIRAVAQYYSLLIETPQR